MANRNGQSATELAIFGALIITAFSFAIMFSERINRQQSYIMQSFRATLTKARANMGPVSYTKIADRRLPNVSSPMTLGNLETFSDSSSAMWGNNFDQLNQSHSYDQVNDASETTVTQTLSATVSGGGGSGAVITAIVVGGKITGFTIDSGGTGYTSAPIITIEGGGGTGATATAVISGGVVTSITVTNQGSGYAAAPSGSHSDVYETIQTTNTTNTQILTKAGNADSTSNMQLIATDKLEENSPDYHTNFYLTTGGKYSVTGHGLIRAGSVGSTGPTGRSGN